MVFEMLRRTLHLTWLFVLVTLVTAPLCGQEERDYLSGEVERFSRLYGREDGNDARELLVEARAKQNGEYASLKYLSFLSGIGQQIYQKNLSWNGKVAGLWARHAGESLLSDFDGSVETERQIDLRVRVAYPYIELIGHLEGDEFVEERRERTRVILHLMASVEKGIDPEWNTDDPKNRLGPYTPPPEYRGAFFSGMSPRGIEDRNVREEYEAHLLRRKLIGRKKIEQRYYRRFREEEYPRLVKQIARAYARVPKRVDELMELTRAPEIPHSLADRFWSEIKRYSDVFDGSKE